jgi:hypothetical protein
MTVIAILSALLATAAAAAAAHARGQSWRPV